MQRLDIAIPVIQAPMGGGPTTTALVAAVSGAGGLGTVAGGYLAPDALRDEIRAARAATDAPFGVNVFAPVGVAVDPRTTDLDRLAPVLRLLEPLRIAAGLPPRAGAITSFAVDPFDQLAVLVEERPPVVTFTFGLLPDDVTGALRSAGVVLMGTATTVDEAIALERAGSDLVCAQGAEAGAHRGTFLAAEAEAVVGTMALVPQVVDAVAVPVVAAGGIGDGRGVAAALALGAGAAQLGTSFLRCPEAGTSAPYRRALAAAVETDTTLTAKVTGRTARGIRNRLIDELQGADVPPYPVMNALTTELRRAAAAGNDPELLSLWAGQALRLATELPAAEIVRRIAVHLGP
jgi:nitronate monooxygenase